MKPNHRATQVSVSWLTASIHNANSYSISLTYTVSFDGSTVETSTVTVNARSIRTDYIEVSPARVLQAGTHTLSLVSGSAHFDRSFYVPSVNQAPTGLSLSNSAVAENQPSGTVVGAFSTTDPNPGNTFAYTLVSGTGSDNNAMFTISGNTLMTATAFNFEAKNSYSIRVRTTDQGALFYEKAFTITVTDVVEPLPQQHKTT